MNKSLKKIDIGKKKQITKTTIYCFHCPLCFYLFQYACYFYCR